MATWRHGGLCPHCPGLFAQAGAFSFLGHNMNYYNEIDPGAADWLENLIFVGEIPDGVVDRRSIEDVTPNDLKGFNQCHFFAGIGGWPLALRYAGVPDDFKLWTGSCPCQPFSAAGKGAGFADERHLWPAWHWLIQESRPAIVLGEQVASRDAEPWLDLVSTDLEDLGFAFGAYAGPSAGVGAPHIRDRTYWGGILADADNPGLEGWRESERRRAAERLAWAGGVVGRLADADRNPRDEGRPEHGGRDSGGHALPGAGPSSGSLSGFRGPGALHGFWSAADWLACRDGKWRPAEPGSFPLAHGVSNRVVRLRAYGNAINPHQGAAFVRAFLMAAGGQ